MTSRVYSLPTGDLKTPSRQEDDPEFKEVITMPNSVFYVQSCPACGRSLQVRVDYLGKGVACQHCHANFVAQQETRTPSPSESGLALLDRADELLKAVEKHRKEKELAAKSGLGPEKAQRQVV